MNLSLIKEEINYYGFSVIKDFLPSSLLDFLLKDIKLKKDEEIERYGKDFLQIKGSYDILRTAFSFKKEYISLIESKWINDIVNYLLNEKAVIHDCFALTNTCSNDPKLARNKFHRDQPWFNGIRTSIHIFLPLVKITGKNGPTEIVPSTHLIESLPSEEFLNKNKIQLLCNPGDVIIMDSSLYHKAGVNLECDPRYIFLVRYQLAFFKQPINLCEIYKKELMNSSELLKQRMGWECRSMDSTEDLLSTEPKWRSGQYLMTNTLIK